MPTGQDPRHNLENLQCVAMEPVQCVPMETLHQDQVLVTVAVSHCVDLLNLYDQMARGSQHLDGHVIEELRFAKNDQKDQVVVITSLSMQAADPLASLLEADHLVALKEVGLREADHLVVNL